MEAVVAEQAAVDHGHLDVNDLAQLFGVEVVKDDDVIDPVLKFRREFFLDRGLHSRRETLVRLCLGGRRLSWARGIAETDSRQLATATGAAA